jgi:hypothetical protein
MRENARLRTGAERRRRAFVSRRRWRGGGAEARIGLISVDGADEDAVAEDAGDGLKLISFRSTISPLEFIASMTSFWLPASTLSIRHDVIVALHLALELFPR